MKILCKGSTKEKGPSETNLFSPESWGKREKKSPAAREKLRKSLSCIPLKSASHHLFTAMAEDHENRSREAFAGW